MDNHIEISPELTQKYKKFRKKYLYDNLVS